MVDNSKKKSFTKTIVFLFVILFVIFAIFITYCKREFSKGTPAAIMAKSSTEQEEFFKNALAETENANVHLEVGKQLMKKGQIDKAIEEFKIFKKMTTFGNGLADEYIVEAYEKNRQYDEAYRLKEKIVQSYEISPENELFRIPEEERLQYLKYAASGEYEQALLHAEKAVAASINIPNNETGKPESAYVDRLNDLIASKDYILSLKNKK